MFKQSLWNDRNLNAPFLFQPTIDEGVNNTFDLLLQDIKVIDLFNQTKEMADKFIDFNKHVQDIDKNYNDTVPELIRLNAEFKVIHTQLQTEQNPPVSRSFKVILMFMLVTGMKYVWIQFRRTWKWSISVLMELMFYQ